MSKNFKENRPIANLTAAPTVPITVPLAHKEPKKKAGRPTTKDVKNTCKIKNIAIPNDLLEKWEDIKIIHGSNLTEYITKLIEKDMESNYEKYKNIADNLKNI